MRLRRSSFTTGRKCLSTECPFRRRTFPPAALYHGNEGRGAKRGRCTKRYRTAAFHAVHRDRMKERSEILRRRKRSSGRQSLERGRRKKEFPWSAHTEESKSLSSAEIKNAGNTRIAAVVFTVIVLSLSGTVSAFEWNRYKGIASSEAVMLAESLESFCIPSMSQSWKVSEEDLENLNTSWQRPALHGWRNNEPHPFRYIMAEREGHIVS